MFPYGEAKAYFSVRAKKNIDLDSGLQVEIKNGNKYNNQQQTTITSDLAHSPNPGKDLGKMVTNRGIEINLRRFVMESWTLLFSGEKKIIHRDTPQSNPPFAR